MHEKNEHISLSTLDSSINTWERKKHSKNCITEKNLHLNSMMDNPTMDNNAYNKWVASV